MKYKTGKVQTEKKRNHGWPKMA